MQSGFVIIFESESSVQYATQSFLICLHHDYKAAVLL